MSEFTDEDVAGREYLPGGRLHCEKCSPDSGTVLHMERLCQQHTQEVDAILKERPGLVKMQPGSAANWRIYWTNEVAESQDDKGTPGDKDPDGRDFARLRRPTIDDPYPLSWQQLVALKLIRVPEGLRNQVQRPGG